MKGRPLILLVALWSGACASAGAPAPASSTSAPPGPGADTTSTNTVPAATGTSASNSTVAPTTVDSTATSFTSATTTEPATIDLTWWRRPPFVVAGASVDLTFGVDPSSTAAWLDVESVGAFPAAINGGRATSVIEVPPAVTTLRVRARTADPGGTSLSRWERLPLVTDTSPISAAARTADLVPVAVIPWGSADGEIGRRYVPDEVPVEPTSIAYDPAREELLIVDTANHKLVVLDAAGEIRTDIHLDSDSEPHDVIVTDDGTAVVIAYRPGTLVAHAVDLATGTVSLLGSAQVPAVVTSTQYTYDPMSGLILGFVGRDYHALVDVRSAAVLPAMPTTQWLEPFARSSEFGVQIGDVRLPVVVEGLDGVAVVDFHLLPTGVTWYVVAGSAGYVLCRADHPSHIATATTIPQRNPYAVRWMAVTDDVAYLMSAEADGLHVVAASL